jgi:hypothetical protein
MARSIRVRYWGVQGTQRKNFAWETDTGLPIINLDSAVIITAAEFTPGPPVLAAPPVPKTYGRPNLGDANVYVTNVGPHGEPGGEAGGVEFLLHVDHHEPLDVVVTITVLEDIAEFVRT